MQKQKYQVNISRDISIEVYDEGVGPLIILLPSLGRGAKDLEELAVPLALEGYRVLRPEPRGNAASIGPLENKTLHDWASDIAAVISQANQDPAWVVGHAHGNWIARTVATDYPHLVKGLILLAASAGKVPKGSNALPIPPEIRIAIENCARPEITDDQRLVFLQEAFFAPGNDAKSWLTGWNFDLMQIQTATQRRTPIDEFFYGGIAPILNIQAKYDVIAPPAYANVLSDYLGDRVTNVQIDHAGHALIPEQCQAVIEAILTYIRRTL
jgi:hypothetical protein